MTRDNPSQLRPDTRQPAPEHRSGELALALASWLRREAHPEPEVDQNSAAEVALRQVFRQLPEPALPIAFADKVMARLIPAPVAPALAPVAIWARRLERWSAITLLAACLTLVLVLPVALTVWSQGGGIGVHSIADAMSWLIGATADWAGAALAFWSWGVGLAGTVLRALGSAQGALMLTTCVLLGLGTWSVLQRPRVASSTPLDSNFLRGS